MFYCFSFSAYIRFFVKVLIETNVNISNELNFSDVLLKCKLHWVPCKVNELRGSFTLHVIQCSLDFDKHLKNEIHALNKHLCSRPIKLC